MQKSIFILLITLLMLVLSSLCCTSPKPDLSGTANPPFEGAPPEDAYISQSAPGIYGGQFVMAIPNEPRTFNVITANELSSTNVLYYHIFRPLIDYRNGGPDPDFD